MPATTADLGVYVWRGPGVLRNWGNGLVVVIAATEEEAWAKLKIQQFGVWANLTIGVNAGSVDNEADLSSYMQDYDDDDPYVPSDGVPRPIRPTRYELDETPVLHQRGSD